MRSTLDTGIRVARAISATLIRRPSRVSRRYRPTEAIGEGDSAGRGAEAAARLPKRTSKTTGKSGDRADRGSASRRSERVLPRLGWSRKVPGGVELSSGPRGRQRFDL